MRALVVYQTVKGPTGTLAGAIGDGLASHLPTDVLSVADAPTSIRSDVGLLVIGGPKVAFGVPSQEGLPLSVRDWALSVKATGVLAAVFDVDLDVDDVRVTPGMIDAAERLLGRSGLLVEERSTFWVEGGVQGGLSAGEVERARTWGEYLGKKAVKEASG